MRFAHLQFRLSTLLCIMLAVGCFYAGLLWDRMQVAELKAALEVTWRIIKNQDEELVDLTFGEEQARQFRAEGQKRWLEFEAAGRRREIETARTWWGGVTVLALWFIVIAIGWLVVMRRQARPSTPGRRPALDDD